MLIKVEQRPAWIEFRNVIRALLKREMNTRFGKYQLGIIWLFLEPLTSVIMLGLILGPVIGRSSGEIPYAFFLLCGFLHLRNLLDPIALGINAMSANQGLLVFRQVEPIDPFIARYVFSFSSIMLSFTVFCILGSWFGIDISSGHLGNVFLSFLFSWLIGCGIGLTLGVKVTQYKELEKITQYFNRPLLFLSCIFYSYGSLPEEAQSVIIYNPLIHTVEHTRMSLFPDIYNLPDLNLTYPAIFAIVTLAIGLMFYRNNRHELKQR